MATRGKAKNKSKLNEEIRTTEVTRLATHPYTNKTYFKTAEATSDAKVNMYGNVNWLIGSCLHDSHFLRWTHAAKSDGNNNITILK